MRRPLGRGRGVRGASLIEVLLGVSLLGIVMVPLSMATIVGWKTVFGIQQKLSSSADAQLLGATFPADVQSAGATGVNPTDPVNQNTCAARPEDGETPLIMFVWDEDLGVSNQTVARYLAKGAGEESQIVRRFCQGTSSSEDVVVARNFGTPGLREASLFTLGENGLVTPQCSATKCWIRITGEYSFQLDVDRRVPGAAPGAFTPDAPTNVHALGGNNRATVYWTEPADNGAPISSYYLEQTPGGTVLGPFFAPATTGIIGVQVDGLSNGQSYTFRVRAANVLGPGPYSEPSGPVTPGPSTPDAPTIGAAIPDSAVNGRATIAWSIPPGYNDGGSPIVGYKVYAQHAPDAPIVLSVEDAGATGTLAAGLSDNTRYTFQVSARNAYGEGSPSATSLEALTLPGAPGTPTAEFSGTSGSVDVTFTPPASGDFTSFTTFRAHILETDTYTTPVPAATACPGATPTSCTLEVDGIGYAQTYSIAVQAQNATGWGPESDPVTNVDLDEPIVTLDTPSASFLDTGTPTIGGSAGTFAGDLPTVTVKIHSGDSTSGAVVATLTTPVSGGAWSTPVTPALSDGQYTVVATQRDATGNTGTSSPRTFTVDTVAPSGSLTAPAMNAWVGGSVSVASNSWDSLSGVASAQFQYSPEGVGSWTTIGTDTTFSYAVTWDASYLTDDDYDLRVVTTDHAGNVFTSPVRTVRVDNTDPIVGSPTVTGTLGSNGWYTSNVTVTWPAPTDALSGIASTTGCGTTSITSNTTGQVVTCSATDNAGNNASDSVTIKRDNANPSSATLDNPGAYISEGTVLTGGGADSVSGVASITYRYCAGSSCTPTIVIGSSSAGGDYPVAWNGAPASGTFQLLARVFDHAGNSRDSSKRTVTIDNDAPSMTGMEMQDDDNDGRIDEVVVTFDQTLVSSTATAPWTLTNVPSGGTLDSVSVSGSTVTLEIDEGSGAKNTAVGSFKVALAASASGIRDAAGNQASFAATAPSDDARPVPVTVRLDNKSGGQAGKAEQGDYVTITYSETMSVAFLCTTWSNDASDQSRTVTATMTNSGSTDPITLGSPCANVGSIRPQASYVGSTRTFPSSTVAWDVSSKTLTITLGTPSSSVSSNVPSSVPRYVPTTSLRDPAGNTMTTATFIAAASSRF